MGMPNAHVLMNKRTGDLMLGYRVTFMDQSWTQNSHNPQSVYQIIALRHDGWVIEFPPDVSPYPLFFNLKVEKMFENLGEL